MSDVTRAAFLRRAAVTGGAVVAMGSAGGWLAAAAGAAPGEEDLAWVHFAVAAEYVSIDVTRATRRSGLFAGRELRTLERATAAHNAHRRRFTEALLASGASPIEDADLEVTYPAGAFSTRRAALTVGRRVARLTLNAYLGAAATIDDADLRRLFAQAAAAEAEQFGLLSAFAGQVPADPFPSVHGLETASEALAAFLP